MGRMIRFKKLTLAHKNKQLTLSRGKYKTTAGRLYVFIDECDAPEWECEGMEVYVSTEKEIVKYTGRVDSINERDHNNYSRLYKVRH